MSVLPYQEIKKLISDKKLVEGGDLESCLGPASYELRIGSALDVMSKTEHVIPVGQEFAIKPQSRILIGTVETVKMPADLCGELSLKSKFGRKGFLPWSQGYVDPGYQGKLTISLINMSPYPEILSGGQKICHIIFHQLKAATQKPYDGEYNGSSGATDAKGGGILVIGTRLFAAGVGGLVSGVAEGLVS